MGKQALHHCCHMHTHILLLNSTQHNPLTDLDPHVNTLSLQHATEVRFQCCGLGCDQSRVKELETENAALAARLKVATSNAEAKETKYRPNHVRTGEVATLPEEAKEKIFKDYEPTAEDTRDDSWKALKKLKRVRALYLTVCSKV